VTNGRATIDERVLVRMRTRRDQLLTADFLGRAGMTTVACRDTLELCAHVQEGAGLILLAEEAAPPLECEKLARVLDRQPPWSDLPLLFLMAPGGEGRPPRGTLERLGSVTVLERPMSPTELVSAAQAALRARLRQYETRDHLTRIERGERELRDIFDNAGVGLHWASPDGTILRVNQTELALLGYTASEYVGRSVLDFHVDRAGMADVLNRLAAGEAIRDREASLRCKDGSIKHVLITVDALHENGQFLQMRSFTHDVTGMVEAQAAQARLAAIVESSDDAIISKTLDGRVLTWNGAAERLFGYTAEEVVGRSVMLLIPPDRKEEEARVFERLRRGERIDHFETVRVTKGGRGIDVSLSLSPVRDTRGRVTGAASVARDITRQKRDEMLLREADRRKDEFLAVLAHELRNPLAPIRNSLHILKLADRREGSTEEIVAMMDRQVDHMVRLVDDLMEVSRITRGKILLQRERIDVGAVIRGAIEASRPLIEAAGHHLTLTLPPEPLLVEGDAFRLSQVVANLLNNAAKYTEPGGRIWLSAEAQEGESGSWAAISVRDNGIGIPVSMLSRVFELFTQIDRHSDLAQGGLGIGLALVKSLVEMHGGTVEARSEGPSRGSEFTIRLPLVRAARPAEVTSTLPHPVAVLESRRILVVDDNRDAAESLGSLLELLGADVRVAYDGSEALRVAAAQKPNVVLLDIGMPGMDGYEVARRLRRQRELRNIMLIALTGWGQDEDRGRSREAGFDYHLTKPADMSVLQSLLTSVEGCG